MLGFTGKKKKNSKPELYKLAQLLVNVPVTQVCTPGLKKNCKFKLISQEVIASCRVNLT